MNLTNFFNMCLRTDVNGVTPLLSGVQCCMKKEARQLVGNQCFVFPSGLWQWRMGDRKDVWPVKTCVFWNMWRKKPMETSYCSCPLVPRKSFDILALYKSDCYYYWLLVKVLRPTQRKIGHFGDVLQANLLASYGKTKPNTTIAHIHQSKEMYCNTK